MYLFINKRLKNVIFEVECIAKVMKKLSFYFLFFLFLSACNSTKHVAEDKHMLTQITFYSFCF